IEWKRVGGTFNAADRGKVFELGFQIFGPSLPQDGPTAHSTIQITSLAPVPEPCTVVLLGAAVFGGIGFTRKRRR
ncbi:MAG TPA: PEP-CTERM sorting domain-containing protein, partial [Lacipirellulaceae bacterium]|nr:PEP-CTERM sorting domain-containing protein [Lacipirellulaceae bacterium]